MMKKETSSSIDDMWEALDSSLLLCQEMTTMHELYALRCTAMKCYCF